MHTKTDVNPSLPLSESVMPQMNDALEREATPMPAVVFLRRAPPRRKRTAWTCGAHPGASRSGRRCSLARTDSFGSRLDAMRSVRPIRDDPTDMEGRNPRTPYAAIQELHQSGQEKTSWLPLPPLPFRQRPRIHPEAPGQGLLTQPKVPPNPGQPFPGSRVRVVGAVAEECDDLRPVGEGRNGLSALPKGAQPAVTPMRCPTSCWSSPSSNRLFLRWYAVDHKCACN